MQKKNVEVGAIYNIKFFRTVTVPVRVVKVGNYNAEVEYLDADTFAVKAVPNPRRFGDVTEWIPFNKIIEKVGA